MELMQKHEQKKEEYRREFEKLNYDLMKQKRERDLETKNLLKATKMEDDSIIGDFDTYTLVKRRAVKLSDNNKNKIEILDKYQGNIKLIKDGFRTIQENTGIQKIDEIVETFIKSEDQNYKL